MLVVVVVSCLLGLLVTADAAAVQSRAGRAALKAPDAQIRRIVVSLRQPVSTDGHAGRLR
jgi:hypothetical protein